MRIGRQGSAAGKTQVVVLTADAAFEEQVRATFGASPQIALNVVSGSVDVVGETLSLADATVAVIDLDAAMPGEMQALERLMARIGAWPPVIVVTQSFDANVARTLLQMRVADFMVKPVSPVELVRTCARVAKAATANAEATESEIYTFLPAVGGAGVTTLAVQTAMMLLNSGARGKSSTCLVDLDFQHGACADYLDLEPRLNLGEIEPRPERLDRQLLEVMLSHHPSGLAVIAAPNRPAEMRSFDPDVVTRLLDMVSTNFDYVVFDMPRTWFSWTDSVLLGSNKLFIISEMTVPGPAPRQAAGGRDQGAARRRAEAAGHHQSLRAEACSRPACARPTSSRCSARLSPAASRTITRLVREAIDRGVPLDEIKPGNKITGQLKKLMLPQPAAKSAGEGGLKKFKLSWAR